MTYVKDLTGESLELEECIIRDAIRGVLWEDKWRGVSLEGDPAYGDRDFLASRAKIWLDIPKPKKVDEHDLRWPERFVGWGSYGWKYGDEVIEAIIEASKSASIMVDTAEGYGFGKVETELGKRLELSRNRDIFIMSKVARNHLGSSNALIGAARRSRDKLGRAISLYQIHWPPPKRNYRLLMDSMAQLLEEGTIMRVGVSNFCAGQLFTAQRVAQECGFNIKSLQVRVSRLDPSALDYLIPVAKALGLRVIAHSPFGQGKFWAENRRWLIDQIDAIRATGVSYIIPGTNNPKHFKENLEIGTNK